MSLGVPVPSKGALRTLRQLALGTSCTVAFTTGLLAEDRRRRIHAAREVQENGRLIKSSRNYHGTAGAVAVANFEDHVLNNQPFYPVTGQDPFPKSSTQRDKGLPIKTKRLVRPPQHDITESLSASAAREISDINNNSDVQTAMERHDAVVSVRKIVREAVGPRSHREGLGIDLLEDLQADDSAAAIKSAASVFLETFQSRMYVGKAPELLKTQVSERLVKACQILFEACQRHNCHKNYIPVLQKVLSLGTIEEDHFYRLYAPEVMAYLLENKRHEQREDQDHRDALHAASSIYLTDLTAKTPRSPNPQMRQLGIIICSKAMEMGLYQLVDAIYWRMSTIPSDEPHSCVNYLILANHRMGYHKNALNYFRSIYVLTEPPKSEFDEVVEAVLSSCLTKNALGPAEDVVRTSAEMARSSGFKIKVAWPVKVLGQHWRASRDLASTRRLFDRMESLADCIDEPKVLYSAIIQFCVEDGNDDLAHTYLDKHILANGGVASMRTCGHLALSKAMKEDWEGVANSFEAMKRLRTHKSAKVVYSQVFAPIFKLYSNSHTVSESEQFLRRFMDEYGMVPNSYVSNIMVGKYAQAKDIDSISQWLASVRPLGLMPDSVTFNAMLTHYRDEWQIPFTDLLHLCRKMEMIDYKLLDHCTVAILRGAAMRETRGDRYAFVRFSREIKLLQCGREESESGLDFWPSMRAAMARGSPHKTLRIYESALKRDNIYIPPDIFALAMQAAIDSATENCIDTLTQLVRDAQKRDVDINSGMAKVLVHQLKDSTLSDKGIHYVLEKNTLIFEACGLSIPMAVATKAAAIFSQRNFNHDALFLWEYHAAKNGISREMIDLSSLTVLLRIHIGLDNTEGVQWVMDTLSKNGITPNRGFMMTLKTGIKDAKKRLRSNLCSDVHKRLYDLLIDSLDSVKSLRASHMVESKEVGGKLLDIMVDAVLDHRRPKVVDIAETEKVPTLCSTKTHAVEADATEQQSETTELHSGSTEQQMETSMSVDGEASHTKHSLPRSLNPKVVSKIPPLSFVDNSFSSKRNYIPTGAKQKKQDALTDFGGGLPIQRLVSNF